MNNNLVSILCLIYIIVYLVVSIYQKPNFEFFYSFQDTNRNSIEGFSEKKIGTESESETQTGTGKQDESEATLMEQIKKAIEQSKLELKEQQAEQEIQNKKINELKAFINQARDDLIIYRNKEHKEMSNIHSQMTGGESLTQVMSSSNGLTGYGNAGSEGKSGNNYNLNFNLENE